MYKFKLCLGVLLVFTLGVLVGILGARYFFKNRIAEFVGGGPPEGMIFKSITNELDLTENQKSTVEKIVADMEKKLEDFKEKIHPEFKGIFDDGITAIKAELNERQKKDLDDYLKKMKERFSKRAYEMGRREDEIRQDIFLNDADKLNLSQKQALKIQVVLETAVQKRVEIIEKYKGRLPEKMPGLMKEMRAREEGIERELREILTSEQINGYEKLHKERMGNMMIPWGPPPPPGFKGEGRPDHRPPPPY